MVIHLPLTKRGGPRRKCEESVTVAYSTVAAFALRFVQALAPDQLILGGSAKDFRSVCDRLLVSLGLNHFAFNPYYLRRGGATAHYQQRRNLPWRLQVGRWRDSQTARLYLAEGAAETLAMHFAPAQSRQFATLAQLLTSDL